MLTYFPTPYPNEWWYSVLCRYHVRSGNAKQQTTVQELFRQPRAALASVFPNSTIYQLCSQLPAQQFPIRKIILRHTLFPYYTRCQHFVTKEEMLQKLCRGEMTTITSIRKFAESSTWRPRYCPRCALEDQDRLGEAYWHTDHQIPLMSHCAIHGCRLIQMENLPINKMDYTFFPLASLDLTPPSIPDIDGPEWQFTLSKILHSYQMFPHEASATEGYSNLAITLSNMGYGVIQKASQHTILNAKHLYHDMIDYYGEVIMDKLFGGEKGLPIINRACKWAVTSPERYALLQCYAELDSTTMFSVVRIEDRLEAKLKVLQGTGMTYTKKQIMERMGVTASQLNILIRKYGIPSFWKQTNKEKGEGLHKLSVILNDDEYQVYEAARDASGYRFDRHFIKRCLMNYIDQGKRDGSS